MTTGLDLISKARTASGRFVGCNVIAAIALVMSICVCAAADAERSGALRLEQLMQRLAQVKTASGKFVERKELAILTTPLESSGTLIYTAPGRLEKHTLRPKPESLILDEKTLTIEDKARNRRRTLTLEEHPVVWAFVESIRATLAGDLKSLNRFYRVSLQGEENRWHLTLKPRDPGMQAVIEEIAISGSGSQVSVIDIHEPRGDRSTMTITGTTQ
jgi:outer membrane lipoprotein-sorting protein